MAFRANTIYRFVHNSTGPMTLGMANANEAVFQFTYACMNNVPLVLGNPNPYEPVYTAVSISISVLFCI